MRAGWFIFWPFLIVNYIGFVFVDSYKQSKLGRFASFLALIWRRFVSVCHGLNRAAKRIAQAA